ncbi:MAG TPA: hypothetical protein PL041_06390 [Melioribacteraceae bacterium]|nr:hypothetical protein [Melioribacteraceae bacterium]
MIYENFINNILKGIIPYEEINVLYSLSRNTAAGIINNSIIENNLYYNLRFPEFSKDEISFTSDNLLKIQEFKEGEKQIIQNQIPSDSVLKYFYNSDYQLVGKHFNYFYQLNLKRKCGLPYAAHLYRVSATIHSLFADSDKRYYYSTLAAIHDSFEDIPLKIAKDTKKFDIIKLVDFLKENIPYNYIDDIIILTNMYDLLIGYTESILLSSEKAFSPNNIVPLLEDFYTKTDMFKNEIINLISVLASIEFDTDFVRSLRWNTYINYYLPAIVNKCIKNNNFSLIELKIIDLLDNAWGMKSLDITGKLRQILKRQEFINLIKSSGVNFWAVNNHLNELQNITLEDARELIIDYLSSKRLKLDYLETALKMLITLIPVLTISDY